MTENKEEFISISPQKPISLLECYMCGDSGLTHELFKCKICHFRSQHRYCSNLYPKAEFYNVCNWCLNRKEDSKSPNSSNSSATCKNATGEDDIKNNNKKKKVENQDDRHNHRRNKDLKLEVMKKNHVIIKSSSQEKSPRKRIINNARLEEKLRRTKSEEISKSNSSGFITRHVFRNKVRRYKLLDEVSS